MMKFLLNEDNLEDMPIAQRIKDACKQDSVSETGFKQVVYQPRNGKINNNTHRYNYMHLSFIYNKCIKLIHMFDYQGYFQEAHAQLEKLSQGGQAQIGKPFEVFGHAYDTLDKLNKDALAFAI